MTQPTSRSKRVAARLLGAAPSVAALLFAASGLCAQTPSAEQPPPAAAPAPAAQPAGGETVTLNPFEITADADKGYAALNENSITAFTMSLDHTPVTADIMDEKFMQDMNITNVEMAIQSYDAGSQFSALSVANVFDNQPGDHSPNGALKLRGNSIGGEQFNGLLMDGALGNPGGTSFGSTSNYDLERIEVVDGPQALLLAGNGSGGVINLVTKQARIDQPTFGSASFLMDQYGTKYATLDYGASAGNFAVRVALVDGTTDTRRINLGEDLIGQYVQLAEKVGGTIIRLTLQQSVDTRQDQDYASITSSSGDAAYFPYNGDALTYLLATGVGGKFFNGDLNWNNAQSFEGDWAGDYSVAEMAMLNVESKWTDWLSTSFGVGAGNFNDDQMGAGTANLYTPGASSNPIPGNWTLGMPSSGTSPAVEDDWRPHRNKAISFTMLFTNELFNGTAKSQTSLNADYTGNLNGIIAYSYYEADSNFNVLYNGTSTATYGRTLIPTQAWIVNNGPSLYNLFNPQPGPKAQRITLNGVNYVKQLVTNVTSPANTGLNADFNEGYSFMNYTQWMGDKLDTIFGVRQTDQKTWNFNLVPNQVFAPDFSAGIAYHVLPWLAPYVSASDAYVTPIADNASPDGGNPPISHAKNYEVGLKFNTADSALSGSISGYSSVATNEEFTAGSIQSDVDPNGLNGTFITGGQTGTGANFSANANTEGITVALTAQPTPNWRMRLSAAWTSGSFGNGVVYSQLYNDQFYENAAGDVTYADGSIVYVPATFNTKQYTVSSATAGAVPLTVALLSTPGGAYYASPQAVTGAILKTSNGGLVLINGTDPANPGSGILTGKAGLPISAYQLNTSLSGVAPVGSVYPVQQGQQTWGYPAYSFNFTSIYQFDKGWFKGFDIGGTVFGSMKNVTEYYYPNGFTGTNFSQELKFTTPDLMRFDLIFGYERKLARVTWSSQINIDNIFNEYHTILFPNQTTGFSVASSINANYDQQPRFISWRNTISF